MRREPEETIRIRETSKGHGAGDAGADGSAGSSEEGRDGVDALDAEGGAHARRDDVAEAVVQSSVEAVGGLGPRTGTRHRRGRSSGSREQHSIIQSKRTGRITG